MGGPCHHNGGGAPHKQINTRACGHISQLQDSQDGGYQDEDHGQAEQQSQRGGTSVWSPRSGWKSSQGGGLNRGPVSNDNSDEKSAHEKVGVAQLCVETVGENENAVSGRSRVMKSDVVVERLCVETVGESENAVSGRYVDVVGETVTGRDVGKTEPQDLRKVSKFTSSSNQVFPTTDSDQPNLCGAKGSGKRKQVMGVCTLTPTKRKLIQNQNIKSLIATFEVLPDQPRVEIKSESPAKRRKLGSIKGQQTCSQ